MRVSLMESRLLKTKGDHKGGGLPLPPTDGSRVGDNPPPLRFWCIMVLNTKTEELGISHHCIDKKKCRTKDKEQKQVS